MSVARTARVALCLLLLAGAAGCRHKAPPPPPPPTVQAAPITPATITVITPLPSVPIGTTPAVQQGTTAPPPAIAQKKPAPHKHHLRRRPAEATVATTNEQGAAAAGTGDHAVAASPGIPLTPAAQEPALGQLSTGTALTMRQRDRLLEEIAAQESRLKKQPPGAVISSGTVLTQAQTFLAKARQAVDQNDLDGASTLTTKARVLLDEMEKQ